MQRKVLFILNPKAGKGDATSVSDHIKHSFPSNLEYVIGSFENSEDFNALIASIKENNFTDVIAVGGDGTVNYIAKYLVRTNVTLGIIPMGSGNGLARTLGMDMTIERSIQQIIKGNKTKIDFGTVNDIPFFCTSGVGFDAHIGNLFATSEKRGLRSYVKIIIRELLRYRSKEYVLKFNDKEVKRKAYLITVANAGQYGNDFYVAPQAKINDGKFHLVILKPFNVFSVFGVLLNVLRGKAHESKNMETYTTEKLTIEREQKDIIHFDGEPNVNGKTLSYICHKHALNVIIGDKVNSLQE